MSAGSYSALVVRETPIASKTVGVSRLGRVRDLPVLREQGLCP
jgi:hypothetical protein